MKILLIGHSHSVAIQAAIAEPRARELPDTSEFDFEHLHLKLDPFHGLLRDSNSQYTDCAHALREQLAGAEAIVLCLEGNWHNSLGMLERHTPYDFFGEDGKSPGEARRHLIPRSLLIQVLNHRMESPMKSTEGVLRASFVDVLTFVREHAKCPCLLVEPPPPMPDARKIAKFRPLAASGEAAVTPYEIRHKLWRLQSMLVRKYCDGMQVDFLPVPKDAFDSQGVLDPRAYEGVEDPTHMGKWYGQLVLRNIEEWLARQRRYDAAFAVNLS